MYPTGSSDLPSWAWNDHAPPVAAPPRRRRWYAQPAIRLGALLAGVALVAAAAGVGIGAALFGPGAQPTLTLGSNTKIVPSPTTAPGSYARVAAEILPSVVSIQVTTQSQQDTGSGVILRSDGYILTNNHVVAAAEGDSGATILVTFNDGSSTSARIVGTDAPDDLAVVKVNRNGLRAAKLGDSATLQVGDPVLAVGSPLGLQGTVTNGIVSALNRPVQTEQPQPAPLNPFGVPGAGSSTAVTPTVLDAIQTDAPINPGNSGGPLVDMAGQVVGINSAIATLGSSATPFGTAQSGNIGVGFAIPIDQARTIAGELIATGHAQNPILGITIRDVATADGATQVVVVGVLAGGPAAAAGVHTGDVIVALDGTPVVDADALIAMVRSHTPGQLVSLTLLRAGRRLQLRVKLGTQS